MTQLDKPIANPIVVLREEFDDWAVLFNPDTADAAAINPVGVAAWKLMDGQHSLDDIAESIQHSFSGVPDVIGEHMTSFVSELAERGFVGFEVPSPAAKASTVA